MTSIEEISSQEITYQLEVSIEATPFSDELDQIIEYIQEGQFYQAKEKLRELAALIIKSENEYSHINITHLIDDWENCWLAVLERELVVQDLDQVLAQIQDLEKTHGSHVCKDLFLSDIFEILLSDHFEEAKKIVSFISDPVKQFLGMVKLYEVQKENSNFDKLSEFPELLNHAPIGQYAYVKLMPLAIELYGAQKAKDKLNFLMDQMIR